MRPRVGDQVRVVAGRSLYRSRSGFSYDHYRWVMARILQVHKQIGDTIVLKPRARWMVRDAS